MRQVPRIEELKEALAQAVDDFQAMAPLTEMIAMVTKPSAKDGEQLKKQEDIDFETACLEINRSTMATGGGLDTVASWVKTKNAKTAILAVQLLWYSCLDNEANQDWMRNSTAVMDLVQLIDCREPHLASAANSTLFVCGINGKAEKESSNLMEEAQSKLSEGKYDEAVEFFTRCLDLFKHLDKDGDGIVDPAEKPGLWICYVGRARAYEKTKQWDKLIDEATILMERILPDKPLGYALVARCKLQTGEFDECAKLIEQAEERDVADDSSLPCEELKNAKALLSAMTGGEELLAAEEAAREDAIGVLQAAAEAAPDNADITNLLYLADRRAATLLQEIIEAEETGRTAFPSAQLTRAELAAAPDNHGFGLPDAPNPIASKVMDLYVRIEAFDKICEKLRQAQGEDVATCKAERQAAAIELIEPVSEGVDQLATLHAQLAGRKKIIDERIAEVEKALKTSFPNQSLRDINYGYDEHQPKIICSGSAASLQAALDKFLPFFAEPETFDGSSCTVLGPTLVDVLEQLEQASSQHVSVYQGFRQGAFNRKNMDQIKGDTRNRFNLEKKMERLLAAGQDQCKAFLLELLRYLRWNHDSLDLSCSNAFDLQTSLEHWQHAVSSLGDSEGERVTTQEALDKASKKKVIMSGKLRRLKADIEEMEELKELGDEVNEDELAELKGKLSDCQKQVQSSVREVVTLTAKLDELKIALGESDSGVAVGMADLKAVRSLRHDYPDAQALSGGANELFTATYADKKVVLKGYKGQVNKETFAKQLAELTRLRHPTIIHADAFFYDPQEKATFVQMDLCTAGNFRIWSNVKARTPTENHNVLRQAGLGLAFLHERNIIHGDIKPESLLMYSDTELRIGDFELHHTLPKSEDDAEADEQQYPEGTPPAEEEPGFYDGQYRGGDIRGSPGYEAPELKRANAEDPDAPVLTTAIDIWSLGAVIFEMLYKKRPEPDAMGNVLVPKETLNRNVSDLLLDMLSSSPAERPSASGMCLSPYFTTPPWDGAFTEAFSLAERRLHSWFNFAHAIRLSDQWLPTPVEIRVQRKNVCDFVLEAFQPDWVLRKTIVYFEHQFDEETMAGLNRPFEPRVGGHVAEFYRLFWAQLEEVKALWDVDPVTKFVNVVQSSENELAYENMFRVIGGMLAKCLLEGYMCPIKFAPAVYKYLLDASDTVNVRDMEACSLDPKDMRELKVLAMSPNYAVNAKNPSSGLPVLEFTGYRDFSEITGDPVKVTDDNKAAYLAARAYDHQISQRLAALDALRNGFDVINTVLKYMVPQVTLTADDLMIASQGYPCVSGVEVCSHLRFQGFAGDAKLPEFLPDLIKKMSSMQLGTLLTFMTGSPGIPTGGLSNPNKDWPYSNKLTIFCTSDESKLPTGHQQFFALESVDYANEKAFLEALEEGLLLAESVHDNAEDLGVYAMADPDMLTGQADKLLMYLSSTIEDTQVTPEPDPTLPPPPAAAERANLDTGMRATVVYDFPGDQEGDLTMYVGQIVVLTANAGEWWSGYVEDDPEQTVGQFPANYVEELPSEDAAGEAQEAQSEGDTASKAVVVPVIPGFEEPKATAVALYDYPPGEPGDLSFNANDIICITSMDAADWWQGYVQGSPMMQGQFPANYVERIDQEGGGAGGDGQRATCIYEYVATAEGDLTMQVDDVIVVVDSSNSDCMPTRPTHSRVCPSN